MKRSAGQIGVVFFLVLSIFAGAIGSASAADGPHQVGEGSQPRTDGSTVVWQSPMGDYDQDILGWRSTTGSDFTIATGQAGQWTADVDANVAVWTEQAVDCYQCGVIKGKRLATGAEFTISTGEGNHILPAIAGDWVVWVRETSPEGTHVDTLMARNISTMADPIVIAEVQGGPVGGGIDRPAIDGDRVLWAERQQSSGHSIEWRLMTMQLGSDTEEIATGYTVVSGPGGSMSVLNALSYDLSGDTVVYSANLDLHVVDLDSGQSELLAGASEDKWSPAQNPTIDGRFVFWQDYSYASGLEELANRLNSGGLRSDLAGYDLQTGSAFWVTTNTDYNADPDTTGGMLVWTRAHDISDWSGAIMVAGLSDILPTAAEPDPGKTDPNWIYFRETGHYVAYGFKNFWERSGGLPVFGFSLTEEYAENGLTVQYFERQRFEYHPDLAGTPYEVLLGRLGVNDAERRGLIDHTAFKPLQEGTESNQQCDYFAETGHRLCHGFKDYWHSHGLEFGDTEISYRESLALFGFPISEEFVDPESGLSIQYFERARFEYHPSNPEAYRILLGRLGATQLDSNGW